MACGGQAWAQGETLLKASPTSSAYTSCGRTQVKANRDCKFPLAPPACCGYSLGVSITGFVKSYWYLAARSWLEWRLSRRPSETSLERSNWTLSLRNPTEFYFDCVRYFHRGLPAEFRAHRAYFHNAPRNRRGYGENAFHVMWYLLLQEFKPSNFLEIGVFRGQVISLAALWARLSANPCDVHGISPFSSAGDSVSRYRTDLDYYADTLANFDHFGLRHPHLLRAYSTEPQALQLIASEAWDMIYIDGNHDYEVASKDWQACSQAIKQRGIIVLDDAGSTTSYRPPQYAGSRGHPGPSRVAQEVDTIRFREILQVGHNRVFQKIA